MPFGSRIVSEWPAWALAAFLLALPFDTSKFGPGNALSLSNIAFVAAAAGIVWTRRRVRHLRGRDLAGLVIAAVFAISFLPSALLAADKSLAFRTLASVIGMAATYSLVVLFSHDRPSLFFAASAWLVGGLIATAGAAAQYLLWLAGFEIGTAQVATLCGTPFSTLRAEGFTGSTNYLGFFVLNVGVAAFGFAAQPGRIRWLGAATGLGCCFTVLLAYSRGGIVALVFAACLAATLLVFARTQRLVPRAASVTVSVVALLLVTRLLIGLNEASVIARINIVNNALRAIASSPVSGTGLGSGVPLSTNFVGFCEQISVVSARETAVPTTIPTTAPTALVAPSSSTSIITAAPTVAPAVLTTPVPIEAPPTYVPIGSALPFALAPEPTGPVLGNHDTHATLLQATTNSGLLGAGGYLVLVVGTLWYGTRRWAARSTLRTAFVVAALAAQVAGLTIDALSIKQMYVALGFLWAVAALEVGAPSDGVMRA